MTARRFLAAAAALSLAACSHPSGPIVRNPAARAASICRLHPIRQLVSTPLRATNAAAVAARAASPSPSSPLYFEQVPPVLRTDYVGTVSLRDFTVAGDVAAIEFVAADAKKETWTRTRTTVVAGEVASVFEPRWDAKRVAELLRTGNFITGYDVPAVVWGTTSAWELRLRFASNALRAQPTTGSGVPPLEIRAVPGHEREVQYTTDVVNLVIPGFRDRPANADSEWSDLVLVANAFYRHFADDYHVIAAMPAAAEPTTLRSGSHYIVRSDLCGWGLERVEGYTCPNGIDAGTTMGSARTLLGIEYFGEEHGVTDEGTLHEIGHQYSDCIDWSWVAGVGEAENAVACHTPLLSPGPSPMSAVLPGNWQIVQANGVSTIEVAPPPIRFHPLTLAAMGLIPSSAVPPVSIFDQQTQFLCDPPTVGATVAGRTREVTWKDIEAVYGPRRGRSIPPVVRRATIVVSRDHLLTPDEMAYWTFLTRRLSDEHASGRRSVGGFGSLREATEGGVQLDTRIVPLAASEITRQPQDDFPAFDRGDWVDVTLDTDLPARASLQNGQAPLRVTGVLRGGRPGDVMMLCLYGGCDSCEHACFEDKVRDGGRFAIAGTLDATHRGVWRVWFASKRGSGPRVWRGPGWGPFAVE